MTGELELSPRMVRHVHVVLSAALKKAVLRRQIRFNPAQHAELPKQTRKEDQAFSVEEANKFLKAVRAERHGILLAFALISGMRPEEYFGLQWKDVDLKAGEVIVRRALIWRTKGGGWYFSQDEDSSEPPYHPDPAVNACPA